jgi:hypothetical protein
VLNKPFDEIAGYFNVIDSQWVVCLIVKHFQLVNSLLVFNVGKM